MNAKNVLFRDIMNVMGFELSKEESEKLAIILSKEFNKYNIYEKEDKLLPSIYSQQNLYYINSFLGCKKLEGLSDSSLRQYKESLKRFLSWNEVDLLKADTNHIRTYLFFLRESGCGEVGIENQRMYLNSFYKWLEENDYIAKNPIKLIKKVKTETKVKQPYSKLEIVKLRDCCSDKRELAIIDLLLSTGIRNSELTKIKMSDVDFEDKTILIHGKGNKQRRVNMSDCCFVHIVDYLKEREEFGVRCDYLICSSRKDGGTHHQLNTSTIRKIIKNVSKRANIDEAYVHKFRRTFCYGMLELTDAITVADMMGHNSVSTTQKYAKFNNEKAKIAHSKLRF